MFKVLGFNLQETGVTVQGNSKSAFWTFWCGPCQYAKSFSCKDRYSIELCRVIGLRGLRGKV
jgi:hypothetical protein